MNKNKGVTLISLVITIIVLFIIVGISGYSGKDILKKAKLEEVKTNMLLIEAKAKEYVENANFKLGTKIENVQDENEKNNRVNSAKAELKGAPVDKSNINITVPDKEGNYIFYYKLTNSDLEHLGITGVESDEENGEYIVEYDVENVEVEVYNTKGYNGKHSLTEIEQIEE